MRRISVNPYGATGRRPETGVGCFGLTGEEDLPDDAFLPSQVASPRQLSAEEQLVAALLVQARDELRLTGTDARDSLRMQAQRWIESVETHWPFSFINVCRVLKLDPDAVRARLRAIEPVAPRAARKAA